jgi:hypothetical protein
VDVTSRVPRSEATSSRESPDSLRALLRRIVKDRTSDAGDGLTPNSVSRPDPEPQVPTLKSNVRPARMRGEHTRSSDAISQSDPSVVSLLLRNPLGKLASLVSAFSPRHDKQYASRARNPG